MNLSTQKYNSSQCLTRDLTIAQITILGREGSGHSLFKGNRQFASRLVGNVRVKQNSLPTFPWDILYEGGRNEEGH